jgi:hypothetical protein
MARVIAGAELVITNQTAGYAIAEGLKKTVLLERYPLCPNVDFDRAGRAHGRADPGVPRGRERARRGGGEFPAAGAGPAAARRDARPAHPRRGAGCAAAAAHRTAAPDRRDGTPYRRPMAESNEDKILENALAPKRASGDAGSMEQHSIPDQIAADEYAAAKRAAKAKKTGVRYFQLIPPGGTGA